MGLFLGEPDELTFVEADLIWIKAEQLLARTIVEGGGDDRNWVLGRGIEEISTPTMRGAAAAMEADDTNLGPSPS